MSLPSPKLVIVSGGSEVVGLALAEAARNAAIPYAVFSLVPHSLLKKAPGCAAWVDLAIHLGDWAALRDHFLRALAGLRWSSPLPLAILPTEDGSLRLLNECRDAVLEYGEFSRARALRMGGVDKAEVVELASGMGVTNSVARSRVLDDPSGAVAAMDELGTDAVFKPALKPLDMDLSGMGGHGKKVVTRRSHAESPESVLTRLRKAWPISQRWIAQPRLITGAGRERSVCAVRGEGDVHACQVTERAKYPRMGGTAYWVSTDQRVDLVPSAIGLMEALDVVGVCELSYLPDAAGKGQLIELNPRPWLQIGLVGRAGFPIVAESVSALRGVSLGSPQPVVEACDWIQPERMLLALLGGHGSLRDLGRMVSLVPCESTIIAGYSSTFPGVRSRYFTWSLRKLPGFQRKRPPASPVVLV